MNESNLSKNSIGLRHTILQGVAGSSPAGAAVATMTGAAAYALGALPLAVILAFLIVLANAYILSRISLRVSGAGGYYGYVMAGHGPYAAFYAGYFYIFYQIMAISFMTLSIAVFLPAALSYVFGITIPSFYVILLIVAPLVYAFFISIRGIKASTFYVLIVTIIEIAVIAVMVVYVILLHPSINNASVFTLKYSSKGITGVSLGTLLMYTSFAGFGSSVSLGEETSKAKETISKSVIYGTIIIGLFFLLTAYGFTVAWGPTKMSGYAIALVPGITIMQSYLGIGAAIIIIVLFVIALLTGLVALINATSRVLMQMARDGLSLKVLSITHKKRMTPHVAATVIVFSAFIISLLGVVILGGFNAFIMVAIGATLGVLFVHLMTNTAFLEINKKFTGRLGITNVVLVAATIVVFLFILGSTFISLSISVYVGTGTFIAWCLIIFVFMYIKRGNLRALQELKS